MRSHLGLGIVCWSVLSVALVAQSAQTPAQPRDGRDGARAEGQQNEPIAEREFIIKAGQDGKAEVSLATLAEKKAENERVKQFAARMIRDHTSANNELSAIAQKKNVEIGDIPAEKKAMADKLGAMDAKGFEQAYMSHMVEDHEKAVELFTRGSNSTDADVKAFASKTLPTLKEHLAEAQRVAKEVGAPAAHR